MKPTYDHTDAAKSRMVVIESPRVRMLRLAMEALIKHETGPRPLLRPAETLPVNDDPHTRIGY